MAWVCNGAVTHSITWAEVPRWDVVIAQIEGAIGFALSSVLPNQVTLSKGVVKMPKVEVHIVTSTARPSDIGEPGVPPVASSTRAAKNCGGVDLRSSVWSEG